MGRGGKEWWLPQDFMQNGMGELFVGYEATARLAELRGRYPNVFLRQKQGRFVATKLNMKAVHFLPENYQRLLLPNASLF